MSQTVPAEAHLGPAHTGKTIEYRVLQIDGATEDVAWTSTDVVELDVSGDYRVNNGVVVQDAGGYIEFRESGPDTVLKTTTVDPAPPTVVQVRTEMDSNSTQLAAIVADTNELQTDWADGGRLDTILDAVPTVSQISTDILATVLESGKTLQTFVIDLWAVVVGNASADDATNPTSITYDSPDDTVQVTHTLTSTTRSV